MHRNATFPVLLITAGLLWFLHSTALLPNAHSLVAIGLAVAGAAMLLLDGLNEVQVEVPDGGHEGHDRTQRVAQVVHPAVRVAVQRQRAQAPAQLDLQRVRQRIRVLHRIELDHADRILDRVGVHRLHVLADPFQELRTDFAHRDTLMGGTSDSRSSAARAWACSPSP